MARDLKYMRGIEILYY